MNLLLWAGDGFRVSGFGGRETGDGGRGTGDGQRNSQCLQIGRVEKSNGRVWC